MCGTTLITCLHVCWIAARTLLKLPTTVQPVVYSAASEIKVACDRIMQERPTHVALDIEWPYAARTGAGRVALMQLAVPGCPHLYLFHFPGSSAAGDRQAPPLPAPLKALLESPHIRKIGLNIGADAAKLKKDFKVKLQGTVDLADLAHERGVIQVRRVQLKALCQLVLHKDLPKDSAVRCSNWGRKKLTTDQVQYAALDAWAVLQLYESLMLMHRGYELEAPAATAVPVGTPVVLVTGHGRVEEVAKGVVAKAPFSSNAAVSKTLWKVTAGNRRLFLTPSRLVVRLEQVSRPAALLQYQDGEAASLGEAAPHLMQQGGRAIVNPDEVLVLWDLKAVRKVVAGQGHGQGQAEAGGQGDGRGQADGEGGGGSAEALGDSWDEQVETVDRPLRETLLQQTAVDEQGAPITGGGGGGGDGDDPEDDGAHECDGSHGPHIKLDILHAEQRITRKLRKTHGAWLPFVARLRDAILVVVPEDLAAVKAALITKGAVTEADWEEYEVQHWGELRRLCRKVAPPPEVMLRRLLKLEELYADIPDAETGKPFFSKEAWKAWKALKEHAEKGCLSDPDPSRVSLYYVVGRAKDGRDILSCSRGTSDLEVSEQALYKTFIILPVGILSYQWLLE